MDARARGLLAHRTSAATDWSLADLLAKKGDTTVSVILPALNEEATVGSIVRTIRRELADIAHPLVDELVVLDSGSTDKTSAVAAAAGATVIHRDDVLPHVPVVDGKGEAMWRGLVETTGDLVVFVDADLRSFTSSYVIGLLGPLLADRNIQLVKAVYERPFVEGTEITPAGGGRVTELVARPLINLHWPELAGVIQPLAGEYAARRSLLECLPFPCGYGVEFALLVDTLNAVGMEAIAQVDLGVRVHRHHDEQRLGRMAAEIIQTAMSRLGQDGSIQCNGELGPAIAQFDRTPDGYVVTSHDVSGLERPPLVTLAEYRVIDLSVKGDSLPAQMPGSTSRPTQAP